MVIHSRITTFFLSIAGLSLLLPGIGRAQAVNPAELATTVDDGFTIAVVGDLIIAHSMDHMMSEPGFRGVVELTRSADVTTGNMETSLVDGRTFRGSSGGRGFAAEPDAARWLKEMGFDIVARANNHASDFGREGMDETSRHLDAVGLIHAGYGDTYWAARSARFFSSAHGRVGMVSTSEDEPRAVEADGEWPGVGGLSPLRVERYFMLPGELWSSVRALRDAFPNGTIHYARGPNTADQVDFMHQHFRRAPAGVTEPYYHYEMNQRDLRDVLASVREGKIRSDFITVAIHSHHFLDAKGGYRGEGIPEAEHLDTNSSIADYLPEFAHAVIDNGADLFQGTGVHTLRGIEIYNDRPIFYGLGVFFKQMDIIGLSGRGDPPRDVGEPGAPIPVKYESIIAFSEFEGGTLKEVRIHPVETRYEEEKLTRRGIPQLASPDVARRILTRLQELSKPLGTTIEIQGDIGIIRP